MEKQRKFFVLSGRQQSAGSTEDLPLTQVLRLHPGLTANDLYYFEQQGWVKPRRIKKGRRSVRVFSSELVTRIGIAWALIEEGYKPRAAFQRLPAQSAHQSISIDARLTEPQGQLAHSEDTPEPHAAPPIPTTENSPAIERELRLEEEYRALVRTYGWEAVDRYHAHLSRKEE